MSEKLKKGYFELLNELENNDGIEDYVITNNDSNHITNDWLANQLNDTLIEKLKDYSTIEEKITFLNDMFDKNFKSEIIFSKEEANSSKVADRTINLSMNQLVPKRMNAILKREIETSEEAILVSPFISRPAVNKIRTALDNNRSLKIKIITTTYNGFSEFLDIEGLVKLKETFPDNLEIKIENLTNSSNERLHSKIYIFKRDNNFSTALLGSSNLSKTGTISGKELNIKISQFREKNIFSEIFNYVSSLENDKKFINITDKESVDKMIDAKEEYKNRTNELRSRIDSLEKELILAKTKNEKFEPRQYQKEALKVLKDRVTRGENKHLLVMATGTGKTALVAFFYKWLKEFSGKSQPKILYIAQRKEILDQARLTFSKVLEMDTIFGQPFYDSISSDIKKYDAVFSTINTISINADDLDNIEYDLVIFDEAHHIKADTYKKIYEKVKDKDTQIIGLTATPKRTEGFNVKDYFFDGEYAFELDLPQSINEGILSDFDYYFINDDTADLEDVDIIKNISLLSNRLNTDKRNNFVYKTIQKYIGTDNSAISALIFCTDIKHAEGVSEYLKNKGLKSETVFGETNKDERKARIKAFKEGKINYLCVVDIFNEGVDLPNINNILLLRPTASPIVYIQQLGRGLRKQPDKRLQIFDFINNIDMKVNKYYNPLMFIEEISDKRFTPKNLINDIDTIVEQPIGDSSFFFEKAAKDEILKRLKKLSKEQNKNIITKIIKSYWEDNIRDYETYKELMLNEFKNPFEFYGISNKTFLEENNSKIYKTEKSKIISYFSMFRNKNLLEEILKIVKTKRRSEYEIVNKLFAISIYPKETNSLDILYSEYNVKDIFELINKDELSGLLKEIEYLIRFKLDTQDLITHREMDGTINSLVNEYFTRAQFSLLFGVSPAIPGGMIYKPEDNINLIPMKFSTRDTEFKYVNDYDRSNKEISWDSKKNFVRNGIFEGKFQERFNDVNKYKTLFIHSDKGLEERFSKEGHESEADAYEFIGQLEEIKNWKIKDKETGVVSYRLKLTDQLDF